MYIANGNYVNTVLIVENIHMLKVNNKMSNKLYEKSPKKDKIIFT